jgi:hypothetical protein
MRICAQRESFIVLHVVKEQDNYFQLLARLREKIEVGLFTTV